MRAGESVLPKFHQHVDFATRGDNTVDLVHTNTKGSYRAAALLHAENSDHLVVMLTPVYKPRAEQDQTEVREVRMWPQGASSALQDKYLGGYSVGHL
ncbi:hypothetical protein EXN66_Car006129 [Channa argus]|uniref:Uncharacterized protein n=1 Tax=Channa argus TaxID=215402 RepID=A0A6G1PKB7_CHAAH|nr:hypothetical protein EXN66_Car006129 [Channa argus]